MSTDWQYDEMKFVGVDYSSEEEVAAYDTMHRKFRDYEKAAQEVVEKLSLGADSTVIDMGAGTGAFSLYAAKTCAKVYAVDISPAMLTYCAKQAKEQGLSNITFEQGGLLSYEHKAEPVDAIVCVAVLHHLPDFWKMQALKRCREMLKPNGKLYLFDVVFPSKDENIEATIDGWISTIKTMADARLADEAAVHIKSEYSTYDWVMEGLIVKSGFDIEEARYSQDFHAAYICGKRG